MSDSDRVIYVAANAGQAHLLKNLLAEHGIEAYVANDTLESTHFEGGDWVIRALGAPGLHDTAPRVIVRMADVEQARRIALDAEAALQAGRSSAELEQLEREIGGDAGWPKCPHCGRPRLTSCPVCETSGTDFDEAFLPESEAEEHATHAPQPHPARMVICPTCDEPFAPEFPPRCEWCGHRFANEAMSPAELLAPPDFESYNANGRVLAVVLGLAALVAAILGWFYLVLRGNP